jgi:adenine-specific DNA glycosylase
MNTQKEDLEMMRMLLEIILNLTLVSRAFQIIHHISQKRTEKTMSTLLYNLTYQHSWDYYQKTMPMSNTILHSC